MRDRPERLDHILCLTEPLQRTRLPRGEKRLESLEILESLESLEMVGRGGVFCMAVCRPTGQMGFLGTWGRSNPNPTARILHKKPHKEAEPMTALVPQYETADSVPADPQCLAQHAALLRISSLKAGAQRRSLGIQVWSRYMYIVASKERVYLHNFYPVFQMSRVTSSKGKSLFLPVATSNLPFHRTEYYVCLHLHSINKNAPRVVSGFRSACVFGTRRLDS